jgi:hypothetical protein
MKKVIAVITADYHGFVEFVEYYCNQNQTIAPSTSGGQVDLKNGYILRKISKLDDCIGFNFVEYHSAGMPPADVEDIVKCVQHNTVLEDHGFNEGAIFYSMYLYRPSTLLLDAPRTKAELEADFEAGLKPPLYESIPIKVIKCNPGRNELIVDYGHGHDSWRLDHCIFASEQGEYWFAKIPDKWK